MELSQVIEEIRLVPKDRLREIYNFIHFFRLGLETEIGRDQTEDIMRFFDEEKKSRPLMTSVNNQIVLDDEGKQIEIKDQNGNQIVLSESGIKIKSPGNISIEADKSVSIKGNTGVSIEASGGDVSLKGLNIKETADIESSAKGSTTAQVEGGAELILKAAMVMIN